MKFYLLSCLIFFYIAATAQLTEKIKTDSPGQTETPFLCANRPFHLRSNKHIMQSITVSTRADS